MKVLITGGSGMIGRELCIKLQEKGFEVAVLSRSKTYFSGPQTYLWNIEKQHIETGAIETSDFILHLAGANLSDKRWSERRKQEIISSRVDSTNLLLKKVSQARNKPRAFISASGVNYYGTITSDQVFNELDTPADDFLGITCQKWEDAALQFEEVGIRTVIVRTAAVLSDKGGALKKMLLPVNLGIGAPIGTGKQYFPWIHIDDLCHIYIKALQDLSMQGAYNAVAPEIVTNQELLKVLAQVRKKPFWAPNVPSWVLKTALGEMSQIILNGSPVSSEKIIKAGFTFRYPKLKDALKDLVGR